MNRKLIISSAIVLALSIALYNAVCSRVDRNIDPKLMQIVTLLKEAALANNINFIDVIIDKVKPENILGENKPAVLTIMKDFNIERVIFVNNDSQAKAQLIIGAAVGTFGQNTYYQYTSDSYIEEEQVESLEEAIKSNEKDFYHFCEKANLYNWFVCTSMN